MKKVKFIYNPNSGDKRIKNEIDTIIQIYQAYGYCVVPYRLTKTRPNEDAFWDIDDNYDHVLLSGGDGTIDLLINIIKKLEIDIPIGILPSGTANDFAESVFKIWINFLRNISKHTGTSDIYKISIVYFSYIDVFRFWWNYFFNTLFNIVWVIYSICKVSYYIKGIEEALNMRQLKLK